MIDDPAFTTAAQDTGLSRPMVAPLPPATDAETAAVAAQGEHIATVYGMWPQMWKDVPLAPFAISREGDWRQHRAALGCAPLEDLVFKPEAMLPDALRVLWFLAHDPAEWLAVPSMKEAEGRWINRTAQEMAFEIETKIRAWADQHVDGNDHALAVALFYQLFNASREARVTVKPDKHHDATRAGN